MKNNFDYTTGYAVIRVDIDVRLDPPSSHELLLAGKRSIAAGPSNVTIKEIVMSAEEAQREVARLNKLNNRKGCAYYWQSTRIFLEGGSHGTNVDPEAENGENS